MARVGSALAETLTASFFASVETELLYRRQDRGNLPFAMIDYLEVSYYRHRGNTGLESLRPSPSRKEEQTPPDQE